MPSLVDTLKSTVFHRRRLPLPSCTLRGLQAWRRKCCTSTAVPTAPFTCIQKRSYGIELSVFYHQNYRGRREHLRQYRVVESVGKVFGLHPQCLEAECSGSGRQGCKSSR